MFNFFRDSKSHRVAIPGKVIGRLRNSLRIKLESCVQPGKVISISSEDFKEYGDGWFTIPTTVADNLGLYYSEIP